MSETAIHENGISMKLCEMCKRNKQFKKSFLKLFNLEDDIDYIEFTGNIDTGGFGKPDITIHLGNGNYFYIEVKTKWNTGFQENQIKNSLIDTSGYIGLLNYKGQRKVIEKSYAFLVDKYHPGCLNETIKIGAKYNIPIVTWNKVRDICKSIHDETSKSEIEWFKEDLENNVDGLDITFSDSFSDAERNMINAPFTIYKIANILDKLNKINIHKRYSFRKNNVKFILSVNKASEDLPNWGWFINIKKEKETNKQRHFTYEEYLWVGINTVLLDANNIIDKHNYNQKDFLFGISVYCDLLSKEKLKNHRYCKDSSGWYYFPLLKEDKTILEHINDSIDDKKSLQKLFEKDIMEFVIDILQNYIPDNTQSLNSKILEK